MGPGGAGTDDTHSLADAHGSFLLDLDGVLYRGDEPIPAAAETVVWLRGRGKRPVFVTNNSSKTPSQVAEKLRAIGIDATEDEVVTSALATADLLVRRGVKTAYVIGEEGIRAALAESGIEILDDEPALVDAVVVGWDRGVTYDRLRTAALLVQWGAVLIATNADASYPAPDGRWPGAGAILAAITTTTGRPADAVVGKPNAPLFEAAAARAGGGRPLVVGDRLDTDIAGAVALGWDSLLVLTGVATAADLVSVGARPTYVGAGIAAIRNGTPPRIRRARTDEAGAIARLLEESGLEADGVDDRIGETFVATNDEAANTFGTIGAPQAPDGEGRLATTRGVEGTVALELFGPLAHLRSLAVRPRRRGLHLATLLCAHAAHEARSRGATEVYAVTETAAGFFQHIGFERLGSRSVVPEPLASTPLIRDRCADTAVVLRLRLG